MKVTIEPETDLEWACMAKPLVYTGVRRHVIAMLCLDDAGNILTRVQTEDTFEATSMLIDLLRTSNDTRKELKVGTPKETIDLMTRLKETLEAKSDT